MSANNSFTLNGATPQTGGFQGFLNSAVPLGGGTPQTKALNNASSNPYVSALPKANTPNPYLPTASAPQPVAPTAPINQDVKSHTVGADGSVTQTYHPTTPGLVSPTKLTPEQQASNDAMTKSGNYTFANGNNVSKGLITGNSNSGGTTSSPTSSGTPPQSSTTPTSTTPPSALSTSVTSQQNTSTSPTATLAYNASNALSQAPQQNQVYADRAKAIADAAGQKISDIGGQGARGEAGYLTTGTSPVGEGNAAVLAQTTAAQQKAVVEGANMQLSGNEQGLTAQNQGQAGLIGSGSTANTATGQNVTAQNSAGNLASPTQVPYNNQFINPLTGQPVGGGTTGTLPPDAQNAVNSYAEQVRNGSMTRADAESRLSAYGVAGTNALNQALGTGFNTNASNASAGTTATGQQIKTAADSTNKALDSLSTTFNGLNSLQTGGIPLTNSIANWIGTKFGQSALSAYKTNLADARSQLIGVLNSAGGTPTGNEATAMQYLPDDMTADQFNTNVGTADKPGIVRQLVQQKVSSFTQSGQQSNSGGGAPISIGGSSFKQDANGNWIVNNT